MHPGTTKLIRRWPTAALASQSPSRSIRSRARTGWICAYQSVLEWVRDFGRHVALISPPRNRARFQGPSLRDASRADGPGQTPAAVQRTRGEKNAPDPQSVRERADLGPRTVSGRMMRGEPILHVARSAKNGTAGWHQRRPEDPPDPAGQTVPITCRVRMSITAADRSRA